jgi:glyoxylase-like metal-dependent hydrolase (beta-lactamase superfamily II)
MSALRVDTVVTSGTFSLDGQTFDVDNNVYVIGDDSSCVVVDAAHDAGPVVDAVAGRKVTAILLTHGHDDHLHAAGALKEATGAPTYLHPDDRMLWDVVYPGTAPDHELADGAEIPVGSGGEVLRALHTPGHSPGSTCFSSPDLGVVLSGDTLFNGGPGATGRSYSDFPTIIESIRDTLLTLPEDTRVLTGHGETTSIGAEAPHRDEWIARGH